MPDRHSSAQWAPLLSRLDVASISTRQRAAIVLAVTAGYVAVFPFLAPPLRQITGLLAVIPLFTVGWLFGWRVAAVVGILGRLPTLPEYLEYTKSLNPMDRDIYRYLNFNELTEYTESAAQAATKRPGALPILQ